jgi:hypothetical protein
MCKIFPESEIVPSGGGGSGSNGFLYCNFTLLPSCDESVVVKVELPLQTPFEDYADSYYEPEADSLEPEVDSREAEVDSLDKKEQLEDEDEQLAKR